MKTNVVRAIGQGVAPFPEGWQCGASRLCGASWDHVSEKPKEAQQVGFWWMALPGAIRISAPFEAGAVVLLRWE